MSQPRFFWPPSRPIEQLVRSIELRPWLYVAAALALAGFSAWRISLLHVDSDLKALLPLDAPSITRLEALRGCMGSQTDLHVVLRSPDPEANRRCGAALAERLRARDELRYVLFHRDRIFFENNALLYADIPDLEELETEVRRRLRREVRHELDIGLDEEPSDDDDDPQGTNVASPRPEGRGVAKSRGGGIHARVRDAAAAEGTVNSEKEDLDDFDPWDEPSDSDDVDADADADYTDELDEEALRERYGLDERLPEYMSADEGRLLVIKARPKRGTTDVAFTRRLLEVVREDIAAVLPGSFHPEMSVTIEGAYANRGKEVDTMAGDAIEGSAAAGIAILVVLGLYFRRLRAVPIVMLPLVMSVLTALGYGQLRFGHLNIVSAFIFAVLLGIGIDFGIHVLGRYEDERHRGLARPDALVCALTTTGMSTLAGAFSTIGVYAFLTLGNFQGFAQFGELAAVGILLALVSVFTVMPAVLVLVERVSPWRPNPKRQQRAVRKNGPIGTRAIVLSALVVAAGLGWAGWSAWHVDDVSFEYDFRKLGPREEPSAEKNDGPTWVDAVGKASNLSPSVILTYSLAETEALHRQIAAIRDFEEDERRAGGTERAPTVEDGQGPAPQENASFAAEKRAESGGGRVLASRVPYDEERVAVMKRTLAELFSVFSFVPEDQDRKLAIIRGIRKRIERKRAALSDESKEKLAEVERYLAVNAPVGLDDLPAWVRVQFEDVEGRFGHFVVFRNKGAKADYRISKELHEVWFDLETEHGVAEAAGNQFVMPEIIDAVGDDAPPILISALLVVLLAAAMLFRRPGGVLIVAGTVAIAALWLVGAMELLGWKANLFNIVAIPLLLGMGQDDALHVLHRHRSDGPGSVGRVLRETGSAVFMTTLTTALGFAGILFANHRGLLSFAWLSVVGMLLCLAASTMFLPALLTLTDAWRARRHDTSSKV